jgi:hypothetical protein
MFHQYHDLYYHQLDQQVTAVYTPYYPKYQMHHLARKWKNKAPKPVTIYFDMSNQIFVLELSWKMLLRCTKLSPLACKISSSLASITLL